MTCFARTYQPLVRFRLGDVAVVVQNNMRISIPLYIEDAIPDDCAFIPAGVTGTKELGLNYGPVEVDAG